jgi:hypothetical protein
MTNANLSRQDDDARSGHDGEPARPLDGEVTRLDPREAQAIEADDRGQRVGRIITTKDYLPRGDVQFTARLGMEPVGTQVILGSLVGVVNSTERKITQWQGKELESVWLNGEFEAIMAGTGEVKAAPTAILPKAFGLTIETALAGLKRNGADDAELTIDCDVGLESTGRPIPYEWIVIYYREGKAQKALRDARGRREARLARQSRKAISGPPKGDFDASGNLIDN